MIARTAPTRSIRDPVAKAECRYAYDAAKRRAGLSGVLLDRRWSDTLTAVEGQRPGTRAEMYDRTRLLFELLADRATWPR